VGALEDALEAEDWASELISNWRGRQLIDCDAEEVFLPALIRALERKGSAKSLAALRALSAVGSESHARMARAGATRLAGRGVSEPPWAGLLGRAEPVASELIYEDAFDHGVSVLIEFAPPEGERHTLGIYIDHSLGGLVKDTFLAGPLGAVRSTLMCRAQNDVGMALRKLDPAEARARIEAGLYMLDHTHDPPVDDPDAWGPGQDIRGRRTGGRRRSDGSRGAECIRREGQRWSRSVGERAPRATPAPCRVIRPPGLLIG
jgi:hypothetical protein